MKPSEQLEQETELARTRVSETLDELRARATPGQLVDQLLEYAKGNGGSTFVRNLGHQVVDNPMPVALVGAGIAWLMLAGGTNGARGIRRTTLARRSMGDQMAMSSGGLAEEQLRGSHYDAGHRLSDVASTIGGAIDSARETGARWLHSARETGSDVADTARDAAGSVSELGSRVTNGTRAAGSRVADNMRDAGARLGNLGRSTRAAVASAGEQASSAYSHASDAARSTASSVGDSASSLGRSVASGGRQFVDLCRDQPLILAGIGLAVGAIIGAALPRSRTENEMMGEASDEMKNRARRLASEVTDGAHAMYGDVKQAATSAIDAVAEQGGAVASELEPHSIASEPSTARSSGMNQTHTSPTTNGTDRRPESAPGSTSPPRPVIPS